MTRQYVELSEITILNSFSPRQTNTPRQVRNRKKPSQALTHCQVYRNRTSNFPTGAKVAGIRYFFQRQCRLVVASSLMAMNYWRIQRTSNANLSKWTFKTPFTRRAVDSYFHIQLR